MTEQLQLDTIYNMDCLEGMKMIPDASVDLIVTSPPYNLGKNHHTGNNRFSAYDVYEDDMPEEDYQSWQIMVLNECFRVLKPGGSIMYNHKNRIRNGEQITPYEWLLKTPFTIKQELVWFNRSQNFDKCRFYPMTERVFWMAKGKDTDFFNEIGHHDLFDNREWPSVGTDQEHKRSFPVKFAEWMIHCFPKADVVLDPFMGSGTTAVACVKEGRHFIGFELSHEYHKKAVQRVKNEQAQTRLF